MLLENIQPIEYIDRPTENSFLPYQGIERARARALARDFAKQQDEIYAAARNNKGDGEVTWSLDGNWIYAIASTFEIVSREDNKFNLNFSKDGFADQIAAGLGVKSSYYLNVEGGAQYFFDHQGNFGKVSGLDYYEPECVEAYHASTGRFYFYKKEQMQAGDFEFVGYMLAAMASGVTSLGTEH